MICGDIVFIKGKELIPWLVRFFDHHGKFSHVCIVIDDNKNILEAQYNCKSHIVPFCYENEGYEIVNLGLSDEQKKKVSEIASTLINRKYDFLQILSYLIKDTIDKKFKVINNHKNFICSELVGILLKDVGVIPKEKHIQNYTPNQLYRYLKQLNK